jgi:Enoyl-(Acyl carrier protein) reductase
LLPKQKFQLEQDGVLGWGLCLTAEAAGFVDATNINAMTRSLAIEYAKDGIRVNAVAPGVVDTPMHKADPKDLLKRLSPNGKHFDRSGDRGCRDLSV